MAQLRIEVISAYNLVVDSNVESPSTYAPRAAYLGATYHNDGTNPLTDVWAYIGDYTNGTPGTYPSRAHAPLDGPLPGDEFALTHEGGALGAADATRYLGTIPPGASVTVYWLVSYPNVDDNGDAVWGPSVKPDDDLWLPYSVWGTAMDGATPLEEAETRTVTMRNEISAMANKIFPNGANKVPQEYQDLLAMYEPSWTNTADDGTPGTVIATEGIWYDLGNVGAGFDNNNDLIPDRNAWLQPVGDAALFDSSCFRLVHTYALVVVKLTDGTERIYNVEDQLYFENIPENNNGAVGYVRYEFLSLRGGCASILTPYQEVASGYDNEKFNGDYGATLGQGLVSGTSAVAIAKSADPAVTRAGSNILYSISYTNSGSVDVGHPELYLPLVLQDSVPDGTAYVAGSATNGSVAPAGASYTVYYSTNYGATWTPTEPVPASSVTDIQWWLSEPLAPGEAGLGSFAVTVDSPFTNASPVVENTAGLSLGDTLPFATNGTTTLIQGVNALGDLVWRDDGTGGGLLGNQVNDGAETGIAGVTVRLYYDFNANGAVDAGDPCLYATNTGASGIYGFADLPDGHYVVAVETTNSNLPVGYTPTTPTTWSIDLDAARTNANAVTNLTADFGFAPALTLTKTLVSTNAFREGQYATYYLTVSNNLPGDGSGNGSPATYTTWATNGGAGETEWLNYPAAFIPPGPDGIYTSNKFAAASKPFGLTNFPVGAQNGSVTNVALLLPIVNVPPIGDSATLEVRVDRLSPAARIYTQTYMATSLVSGTWEIPMTGTFAWAWADFATNYTVTLLAAKNAGGAGTGWLQVDAVGFRIQSDQTTGVAGSMNTLDPVPLTDQYPADLMQFVGAVPPATDAATDGTWPDTLGTLSWSNVGPIYPGGTSTVAVTFKLLEPFFSTETEVVNAAWVTNALLQSGLPANSATGSVSETLLPAAAVGDVVWRDLNGDGVQNETNAGIAGVAVSITPPGGVDLGNGPGAAITNWTDAGGAYLFESIPVTGVYTVRVVTATLPGGTGTNTYDEDGIRDHATAVYLDIYAATNSTNNVHLTTDFGYQTQTTIEGTIWHDWDRGGETNRESGEDWLTNVTVYLCASPSPCGPGASIATNATDANGFFRFVGNYTGAYTVAVATNTGMLSNGTWNPSFDTDGTNTANYAQVTVVSGGVARADYSYGRTGNYALGDTLYYDWDGNGVQSNAFEEGIPSVTVYLYEDANGNGVVDVGVDAFIASAVTASNGYYSFTNLFATNTYLVYVDRDDPDLPSNYVVTGDPYGAMDARSVVTITNANDFAQDFGFRPYGTGAIGDTVFLDLYSDGIQIGIQERGLSNVTASLYVDFDGDGDYVLLQTASTDANGNYLFDGLPDGDYRVVVDVSDADLPVDNFGIPFHPTTVTSYDVAVSGGSTHLDADFGFVAYGAIGDTIFWDANRNGTQDTSEEGVAGVEVRLYVDANANGVFDLGETMASNLVTDADGKYLFDGLWPSNYVVWVVTTNGPLLGTTQSADPDSDGYACADTNNAVPCDDQTGTSIMGGQNFMGADFGYAPPGVIGDRLWVDTNDDGVQDPGESGISYVSVVLYSNGVAVATNETDGDGYYYFSDLPDGTWSVTVLTNDVDFPPGLAQTYDPDGVLDSIGTNIVISGGSVTSVGGAPCTECDLGIDFGYRYLGNNSLSGTIGFDAAPYDGVMNGTNASGVATNEGAYADVQVYLYLWNDDGDSLVEAGEYVAIASTTTSTNGDYAFTDLPNGDGDDRYIVASSAPEDYLKLTTTNGSIAGASVVETTNAQGSTVSAYLTVAIAPVLVGMDFAYHSTRNYDYGDLPESYETLLPGGARHIVPAATNLYLGAAVDVESNGQPSAGADGDDLAGADDEDGVDLIGVWQDGPAGGTLEITVGAGSGWLVGYIDFNGDGDFSDYGELAIDQAASSTGGTNADGVYAIPVDVPPGTINAATTTALNARFRLFPEAPSIPELAFSGTAENGEVEDYAWSLLGSVGDYVWEDLDVDGVQDVGEPPIAGARVFIDLDADGQWDAGEPASTTDTNGFYSIGGLTPDTYSVRVDTNTLSVGLVPTYDRDGIATKHAASVTLLQGEVIRDVDFGYHVAIADLAIWKTADTNAVNEGGTVVFTVSVTNLGPDDVETIRIGDLWPSGLTYVGSTPSQGSYDDGTGEWTVGALAVSNGATLAIEATADVGTGGWTFTNVASLIESEPVDPNPSNNAASAAVTVRGADLQVRKVADNLRPDEGDPVTYRVSVTNLGPSDTTGVAISDPLPAGVTYVSHVASLGAYDDGTGLWTVGSLAMGAGAWLDISVTVDSGTLGTVITNVAAVSAQDLPDPVSTNDSAAVRIYVPPLVLYKTASPTGMVQLGDTITYTIVATNIGPWVHTNVVITDAVPAGTVFVPGSVALTAYPARSNALESVRDEFSAQAYANQDGDLSWSADWQEGGESDGPTNGSAQVLASGWASLGLSRSLARSADLSLAESAELSFVLRQATTTRTNNFRDEFGAAAYTNNNGTLTWSGNWLETGDDLSATAGDILVSGGLLSFSGLEANDEVARWAVFPGNTNATLTFAYVGSGLSATRSMNVYVRSNATDYLLASYTAAGSGTATLDLLPYLAASNRIIFRAGGTDWASQSFTVDNVNVALSRPMQTTLDNAYVEVSTNGTDWTTLFYANGNVAGTVATNYDLTAYRSPQTTVRFRTTGYTNAGAQLWFDDVDVELSKIPGADEVGDPPTLLDGWILGTNEGVRLTYDVVVDEETFTTQIVNVASATSDLQPDPVWASATTRVDLVGVEIGDRIWFDADRDGLQDPEETNGIANLTVQLMRTNGAVVKTVLTDADGNYLFDEVVPGRYFVRVGLTNVSEYVVPTTNLAGGDVEADSNFTYDTNAARRADSPAYDFADGTADHSIDLGLRLLSSTRAVVAEVWGEAAAQGGKVVWRTGSEWNTAGFFVYRVDPETGDETRLNDALVPSAFNASGAVYELVDPQARAGGAGTYRIEEMELTGAALDLGTHAVAFAAARPRAKTVQPKLSPAQLATPKWTGPSSILKVRVRDEGFYGVGLQAIADGLGIALADAQALAAGNGLSMTEQGVAVPTIYDEARARLVFHGQPTDNWYTRDNVYLVSAGTGRAMARREPGAAGGETVFPAAVRFEQDRYPFDSAAIRPADFYYWDYVIAATNEKATSVRHFPLDLAGAAGDVSLKVRLIGWSSTTNDPDHFAEFRFNGIGVGSIAFDGQAAIEAELAIPAAAVSNGLNTLSVKGVLPAGRTHSYFVVDGIEAAFARELVPLSGTAHFRAGGAESVSAAAFAEPLALALDESGTPTWIADESGNLPDKAWVVVASSEERFAVAEADAVPMLEPEAVAAAPWFLAETNRIDYLVISSRALESAAQELADVRAGQGLRVGVATFEDVCDWMADGLRTPEAVPALLAYAQATWAEAPWMVLLAGNGHYDYLGALSNEVNHVPPLLVQTADGIFSSDNLLADADGDGLPDVAIGRLPALTTNDLAAMVAKIRAYELGFGEAWANQFVLATDANDAAAGDFKASAARFAALLDAGHPLADAVDLNTTPVAAARVRLMDWFNAGAGFIHYTGHGGAANWSSRNLLKATDVAAMNNASRPPAVVALSCLVGRYEAPGVNSLGELLLRKAGGGSVAAWGPSGLSRHDPATALGESFYRAVLQDGCGTLGLAILRARRSLSGDVFTADTLAIYNLLGDPALRIAGNRSERNPAANFAQWRWERFAPAELADPNTSGATAGNFSDYALDGGADVEAELPEFGYALPAEGDESGFILRWKRRAKRDDVEYHLLLSSDLQTWEAHSSDLEEVGSEIDPDGVMETVRTRIKRPEALRVFIGIRAKKK